MVSTASRRVSSWPVAIGNVSASTMTSDVAMPQSRTSASIVRLATATLCSAVRAWPCSSIDALVRDWGMATSDVIVEALTFPIATGQEESRRDAVETIDAIREIKRRYPEVQTTLGVSNVSFGLNPAARVVLNSVFLHEATKAGLDSAIVHAAKILPMSKIDGEQRQVALDMVYDRRRWAEDDPSSGTLAYDPLQRFLELFEGVDAASLKA